MKIRNLLLSISIISIAFLTTACSASPSNVVKGFYNAVDNEQYEKAVEYFSSNVIANFGLAKLQQVIASQAEILKNQGGVKSIDITDETIVDNYATVTVNLTMNDGSTSSDTVSLVKEDGKWKIDIGK